MSETDVRVVGSDGVAALCTCGRLILAPANRRRRWWHAIGNVAIDHRAQPRADQG